MKTFLVSYKRLKRVKLKSTVQIFQMILRKKLLFPYVRLYKSHERLNVRKTKNYLERQFKGDQ